MLGLHAETDFGPCDYRVEEELKLAGDNNKPHAIWALLITTFQQQLAVHQLMVTLNKTVGYHCHVYQLNDPPPFLSGFVPSTRILLA